MEPCAKLVVDKEYLVMHFTGEEIHLLGLLDLFESAYNNPKIESHKFFCVKETETIGKVITSVIIKIRNSERVQITYLKSDNIICNFLIDCIRKEFLHL